MVSKTKHTSPSSGALTMLSFGVTTAPSPIILPAKASSGASDKSAAVPVTGFKAELVNDALLKSTGASGVVHKGNGVQIIYGPRVTVIKSNLEDYLETAPNEEYTAGDVKETAAREQKETTGANVVKTVIISSPVTGTAADLSEAPDEEIIYNEIEHSYNYHPNPVGFGSSLENSEQEQVNDSAGKSHAHAYLKNMHQHIGAPCQNAVDSIEKRRHKQERKFQRLCDAGQHGSKGCRHQKSCHRLLFL